MALETRPARADDLAAITRIYNHYVRETAVTFDIEPFEVAERRAWLESFRETGPHRLFVATDAGAVVGYALSHSFRPKAAYHRSVETTIYLDASATRRGIGTRLYETLFEALAATEVHRAYAGVTLPNEGSIALHRRFGYESIGVYREVGHKFGRYWDVQWFERAMN